MIQLFLIMRPLFFYLRLAKLPSTSKTISYGNLTKSNAGELLADLKRLQFTNDPSSQLSEAISLYNLELSQLLDQQASLKWKTITKRVNSKWYTGELGDLKREAHALACWKNRTGLTID